ncbi:Cytochrome P450 [Rhypophila sp. PSN 637]
MADASGEQGLFGLGKEFVQNVTIALRGLNAPIWLQSPTSPVQLGIACLLGLLTWRLFTFLTSFDHDPNEPPLIKPKIPVVGHFWGLLRSQVNYFSELYSRTKLPIATLPIANKKLYVIFEPAYQQAALKSNQMDAQSFMVDFVPRIFGVKKGTVDKLLGKDGVHPNIMSDMEGVFNTSLSGNNLQQLLLTTLKEVANTLNAIDKEDGLKVPNLFIFFQNLLTRSTSTALWGKDTNPYNDQEVIDAQWDFEGNLGPLVIGFFPSIIARRAYLARSKIQSALSRFYMAKHDQDDPDVSSFVRLRSKLLRGYDIPPDELAKNETAITLVATTNALSTLFWCVAEIFSDSELLSDVKNEVFTAVFGRTGSPPQQVSGKVKITAKSLLSEENCPLLNSCYRESIRLASQIVTARRVLTDMTLFPSSSSSSSTSKDNNSKKGYLLKADTNVMMPAKPVHRDPSIWGPDADTFNPKRFITPSSKDRDKDPDKYNEDVTRHRRMKASFVPFGGGKHLCPGRHYAFLENLSIIAALVLGFDIAGLDRERLKMGESKRGETAKPIAGFEGGHNLVLRRRGGWEDVQLEFGYDS